MSEQIRELTRITSNIYYSYQDIRTKFMNQMRDVVRKLDQGIAFDEVEEKKEVKDYSSQYKDTELLNIMEKLQLEDKVSKEFYDYYIQCWNIIKGFPLRKKIVCKACEKGQMVNVQTGGVRETEDYAKKLMNQIIKNEPIYVEFLSKIKGIAGVTSAVLLKNFGYCEKFETVSKLWAYTGNHVINGKAPKRERGKELGYSLKLKTFTWKISDTLMKSNKGYYRKLYDTYRKSITEREHEVGVLFEKYGKPYKEEDTHFSKGHTHNMALRKVRKRFLSHYWEASRELVGLPTEKTYVEGVLGHEHIVHWKEVIAKEDCLKGS